MRFDFLMCSERSGSNLITQIMNAHSQICGPFPRHGMSTFVPNYYKYGDINNSLNWETLAKDMAKFMNCGFSIWNTEVSAENLIENVKERSLSNLIRYFYETEAKNSHKTQLFIKENHAYKNVPFILSHFPDAKWVWMVRDPRDMALTWKEATVHGGVKHAVKMWLEDQRESLKAYGYLKALNRICLVKFEDLLQSTPHEVRRICEFLEVPYEPSMLDFYKNKTVVENSNLNILGGWKDLKRPILKDNFGRYKFRLTEAETQYIEILCQDEMKFFDYAFEYQISQNKLDQNHLNKIISALPDEDAVVDESRSKMRDAYLDKLYRSAQHISHTKLYINQ